MVDVAVPSAIMARLFGVPAPGRVVLTFTTAGPIAAVIHRFFRTMGISIYSKLGPTAAILAVPFVFILVLSLGDRPSYFRTYTTPEERLAGALEAIAREMSNEAADFGKPLSLADTTGVKDAVKNKSATIIDARPGVFYRAGHIPGAYNLSIRSFQADYLRQKEAFTKAQRSNTIVYCSGGSCADSEKIARALLRLGFSQVAVYAGGWSGWQEARQPVESTQETKP